MQLDRIYGTLAAICIARENSQRFIDPVLSISSSITVKRQYNQMLLLKFLQQCLLYHQYILIVAEYTKTSTSN